MATKFKTAYGVKNRKAFLTIGSSETKQSFKRECDMNHILAQYRKTGMIAHKQQFQGDYQDISGVPTYHDAMQRIITAQEAFESLPAEVRKEFNNDPATFIDFVSDSANIPRMEELGLVDKVESKPTPEEITPATPPAEPPADPPA